MILGVICTILGCLGVYGVFADNMTLVIIGGIAGLVENLIGISTGQQKSLTTAIIAAIIGIIFASSQGESIWIGIMTGLCFESVIMGVFGWVTIAIMGSKLKQSDYD